MRKRIALSASVLVLTILVTRLTLGLPMQPSAFSVPWWTADGGGGKSSGASYELEGTIGQPDAGTLGSAPYELAGGFWSPQSAPGTFSKSSPSNGATGIATSPTLAWGSSSGATDYEYCYDTSNDNACSTWTSNGTNTSAPLSGLSAGTTYYWHVRANNSGGTTYSNGSSSAFWSFTTATNPPGAFSKSSPGDGATGVATSPTLAWGSSSGATDYEYCFDTSDDNACSTWTSNGTSTSAPLSGLSAGTTYYWHVRANSSGGTTYSDGGSSAFWSFTTTANPPGAFSKSSPGDGATGVATSPTLAWGSSSGATDYEYCYDTSNDNACSTWTSNGTNTSAPLSGLSAGTTYYWHVRANSSGGTTYSNGSSTAFWSFTTATNPPGAFSKSSPGDGATGVATSPTLAWGSSSGATDYEYCYDTSDDNACSSWTSNGTSTSTPLSGLSADTTYYWHVRANSSGGTTYSDGDSTAFWSFATATNPDVFLPMLLKNVTFCYPSASETEPNDLPEEANGPLCPPQTVSGFPDDNWDWFTYQHPSPGQMTISLNNHTGSGVQLHLYDGIPSDTTRVVFKSSPPYQIVHSGAAGLYYIGIYTESDLNTTTLYDLTVTTP